MKLRRFKKYLRRVLTPTLALLLVATAYQLVVVTPVAAGTYWQTPVTVDSGDQVGQFPSIALDTGNYPHISYQDITNHDLKYAYKDAGGWSTETADSAGIVGQYTSIALDGSNYPHISYFDSTNDDLKYAYKDGTGWQTPVTVDSAGNVGSHTSIALDTSNYPHISYFDETNTALKYAYKDGTGWQTPVTVDSAGNVGSHTSIALHPDGYPHISYYDLTNGDLKYAYKDGLGWHTEALDSDGDVGMYTSIALDSGGYPHISYWDMTNTDLKYSYRDNILWHVETADSSADNVGFYTSIALDTGDYPHISYCDTTNGDLKYAYKDGTGWQTPVTVDSAGWVGVGTSIALDIGGLPHISYFDSTNGDLKYARLLVDNTPPNNPTDVQSTSHTIDTWSKDNTVDVTWTAATDAGSGLDGYSILWDTTADTIPDQTKDIEEGVVADTSPSLADGGNHYFHISSVDNVGNWQSTFHLGPFFIDNTPPSDPTDVTSTSHTVGTRSRDNTVDVAWTAATDTESGLDGYSVLWDTNDTTIPDQTKDIEEVVSTTSPALADGDSHYLHISSVDNAGNWQSTVHLGPFVIDTTRIGAGRTGEGPDFTPPKITGLCCSNAGLNGITITWTTNEPSTSQVEYWASAHQFSPSDEELTEYHEVELTGLNPCTTYHYCTISIDASDNEKVSEEETFSTLGEPASFAVSDLAVSPARVEPGEEITVGVLVSNTGDACGAYTVKLKVGEVTVASREVTLDGGAGEEIILTTYMNVPGTCSIDVNGLSGTVMVEAPLPPPPAPTPTPEPTSPVPPAPTPPEGDNRLLIAAIITASTAAGLGGYYRVRRHRAKGRG